MAEQFSSDDYHEPMYNMGMSALGELAAAKFEGTLSANVSGVTTILGDDGKFAYKALTEYRARVIDGIHPDIVHNNDLPPEYVVGMLGSLSFALIDHVNQTQGRHGHDLSFPPDARWLRNHIGSLWLIRPRVTAQARDEMNILAAGGNTKINLVLAKDANNQSWSTDYVIREHITVVRDPLADDAVTLHECDTTLAS